MKMKILTSIFIAIVIGCIFSAFKPQETGQVYFIRSTNSVGSLVAYHIYVDDTLVCHLKNTRYSLHTLKAGEHTVAIQNTGLSTHKKSSPLKINIIAGKSVYLIVVNGLDIYLQEVVESSAQDLLKRVFATAECLPAKKEK